MRRVLIGVAILAPLFALTRVPAQADVGAPSFDTRSQGNSREVTMRDSKIHTTGPLNKGGGNAGVPVTYVPPACWYEPSYTSDGMMESVRRQYKMWQVDQLTREYAEFKASFGDYHVGDKGKYWTPTCLDYGSVEAQAWLASHEYFQWVDDGVPPPAGTPTADVLARLARAMLDLPEPDFSVSPANTSYVNLATWVWAAGPSARPLEATASLEGLASIRLIAEPDHVLLKPGTAAGRAQLHPASGVCSGTGQPYHRGVKTPPCGVTYLRSTADVRAGYPLQATIVWKVRWEKISGIGPAGGVLDDGVFGETMNIQVGEVQSVVEESG